MKTTLCPSRTFRRFLPSWLLVVATGVALATGGCAAGGLDNAHQLEQDATESVGGKADSLDEFAAAYSLAAGVWAAP